MASNLLTSTVTIVGGIGLGALAMYLLDPDQGPSRRSQLQKQANTLAQTAGGKLHLSTDDIADGARHAAKHLRSHASSWAGSAQDAAQAYGKRGVKVAKKYGNKYANQAMNQASGYIPSRHSGAKKAAGIAVGGVACIGLTAIGFGLLGAGAMYFMDPEAGQHRRGQAGDKLSSYVPKNVVEKIKNVTGGRHDHHEHHDHNHDSPIREAAYPRTELSEERSPSTEQL